MTTSVPLEVADSRGRCLAALREPWPRAVCRLLEDREPVVRVLIAAVRGSAPREPGACMLLTRTSLHGTIGGGNLEWQAIAAAQSLLATADTARSVRLQRLVLGRELGQCCGGVVQLWLERFTAEDVPLLRRAGQASSRGAAAALVTELSPQGGVRRLLQHGSPGHQAGLRFSAASDESAVLIEPLSRDDAVLWLYGAGHVGQALIRILAELPFEVTWIDSRAQLLPDSLPEHVHPLCSRTPAGTVELAPPAARFLVMTHDHALDYALCRRILGRGDFSWLGLIGSHSKAARFRSRLARDGVAPDAITRLVCPIGVEGVVSKWPAAIAVGVAAQLLQGLAGASAAVGYPKLASACTPLTGADACPSSGCAACSSAAS